MNRLEFHFAGQDLTALPSGALWWAATGTLVVSDLHLGKAERRARRDGQLLPPYETQETLDRLDSDIAELAPARVICLGDSFDDLWAAAALADTARLWLARLQAGREWIWIEGNHDPGATDLGGTHRAELALQGLTFRHIAAPEGRAEVSGHYHPKVRLPTRGRLVVRRAFLLNARRLVLPAYGAYTGGLSTDSASLTGLMGPGAEALLTGKTMHRIPMPC
ncbi:MAG: ligase-associated DNA damage response endonuclease PdeM [Pseudomonadota bacterium]